jgi:hypothetical protein
MKKPYIQKFLRLAGFTVWIVDGKYIRDKINEEFTNYGQSYLFSFIPKNEFWIDKEHIKGEERYYIGSMLLINRLMGAGMPHKKAAKKADIMEKGERAKSLLMKSLGRLKKYPRGLIDSVHKNLLGKYGTRNIKIWRVNGEAVRGLFFLDFTEGGHGYVYPFIPKEEIWIDDDIEQDETGFVLLHELHERRLMAKQFSYSKAHEKASAAEFYLRHHKKGLNKALKKEIAYNERIK